MTLILTFTMISTFLLGWTFAISAVTFLNSTKPSWQQYLTFLPWMVIMEVQSLTFKSLGIFFFQNVIIFSNVIPYKCNILAWNWSNTMNIFSALWLLMVWCFSTRASVATLLSMHPSISSCLVVNKWQSSTVDPPMICIYMQHKGC